jgi:hypothetical protein
VALDGIVGLALKLLPFITVEGKIFEELRSGAGRSSGLRWEGGAITSCAESTENNDDGEPGRVSSIAFCLP